MEDTKNYPGQPSTTSKSWLSFSAIVAVSSSAMVALGAIGVAVAIGIQV